MPYLNLDKTKVVNLEYSLYREVLRTNRAGSYCSSTIINCNTRKYHGMLVCPVENFGGERFVLLSSLDVSLIQHEQIFNLGIRKYSGNNYEPKGHKYMTDMETERIPKRVYRVGGMILSTETLLAEDEELLLHKVMLEEANSPTKIRFKPFLAFRSIHELTKQNMEANTRPEIVGDGIKLKMYDGFPYLHMQLNKKAEFVTVPDWYLGVEYIKEQHRGFDYKEDLFVPGYFEADIAKGESIVFAASTSDIKPAGLKAKFTKEFNKRIPRNTLLHNLMNAGEQFIQKTPERAKLIAGYHWYDERLRDSFVALPGLMTYQNKKDIYIKIFDEALKVTRQHFMTDGYSDEFKNNLKNIDVPLWSFYTIQQIEQMCPDINVMEKYGKFMFDGIQFISTFKRDFLHIADSGLIYAKIEGKPLTWMNAIVNGKPVTWRPGYTVEENGLWYNALCYYAELCEKHGKKKEAKEYAAYAQKVQESFVQMFWNEEGGYLYDYVDGNYCDASVRPNQVIAVSLPYSPLDVDKRKRVIDVCKKELLTPRGLRSLSPQSPQYEGVLGGNQAQRDLARHQGATYPWLTAFFLEAYLNIHKHGGVTFAKRMLDEMEEEMGRHCLGTVSECYNGNPPHTGKEAVSMAWNVAGVMRVIKLIEKYS
ncbi:MAG: glycogen debranching enzyme N-terminal domain-containing protein [Cytophagaceae bacterium]|jgi:predicted glycogen debranching enzyme|nr:glycogen debranching enzyme N-terminal domain-containing protein [Cytophagaceae bacterium]